MSDFKFIKIELRCLSDGNWLLTKVDKVTDKVIQRAYFTREDDAKPVQLIWIKEAFILTARSYVNHIRQIGNYSHITDAQLYACSEFERYIDQANIYRPEILAKTFFEVKRGFELMIGMRYHHSKFDESHEFKIDACKQFCYQIEKIFSPKSEITIKSSNSGEFSYQQLKIPI